MPTPKSTSRASFSLAGFQVTTIGRFWVTAGVRVMKSAKAGWKVLRWPLCRRTGSLCARAPDLPCGPPNGSQDGLARLRPNSLECFEARWSDTSKSKRLQQKCKDRRNSAHRIDADHQVPSAMCLGSNAFVPGVLARPPVAKPGARDRMLWPEYGQIRLLFVYHIRRLYLRKRLLNGGPHGLPPGKSALAYTMTKPRIDATRGCGLAAPFPSTFNCSNKKSIIVRIAPH
jgi:hypothetical protein